MHARCPHITHSVVTTHAHSLYGCRSIFNDKSKGVTWLLDLQSLTFSSIELPLVAGNHEAAVSVDGLHVVVPHYEDVTQHGQGEGGGEAAGDLSVINLRTGRASVLAAVPNPFGTPKPHDAAWLPDGSILTTAQVANAIVKYLPNGSAISFAFLPELCNTPHLLRIIPGSQLAVSGCRCTNSGCTSATNPNGDGHLVLFDTTSGEYESFEMGPLSEGITVTGSGDVWIGSQTADGYVRVFSFGDRERALGGNLRPVANISVPYPLRLACDHEADTCAVASLNLGGVLNMEPDAEHRLRLYRASTKELLATASLTTARGAVHMEGIRAFSSGGRGYFVTGGFDTQTVVVLLGDTLETILELYLPYCSTPAGFCESISKNATQARQDSDNGWNNWSGGLCPATMRSPLERRRMVVDGFNWSPERGEWA